MARFANPGRPRKSVLATTLPLRRNLGLDCDWTEEELRRLEPIYNVALALATLELMIREVKKHENTNKSR